MNENTSSLQDHDIARHDASRRDTVRHTMTIKQAAELFARYDVPRSPRSVQRFCDHENIDCIRVKGDKAERYFVDPVSVERYAQELKQLENISNLGAEAARNDATQRDVSRHSKTSEGLPPNILAPTAERPNDTLELRGRIDILDKENFQLKIDRAAKEQVIGQMVDERRIWLTQLTEQNREIGRLEMQMQQLAAPGRDMTRHVATAFVTDVAAAKEPEVLMIDSETQAEPVIPAAVTAPEKRSIWRRVFG